MDYLLMDYDIMKLLTNFEVHDISDFSDHCAIEFAIRVQTSGEERIIDENLAAGRKRNLR